MLLRVSLVALGVALALAGCQGATPVDKAEPDTAPEFAGTVGPQTYKVLQEIEPLTLPSATGGNGDRRYTLEEDPPPGLEFDSRTRTLTGNPHLVVNDEKEYPMTYRVEDSDDNTSSRDADTLQFTITIQPDTILENVVSSVTVGEDIGRLKYAALPAPSGGPAISVAGSSTIVAGGAFFLDIFPASNAPVDTLLISVDGEDSGYYEIGLEPTGSPYRLAAPSYRLVGLVPYDLDPTRSSLGLCVTAVHAIDRVSARECHDDMDIAEVVAGDVQVTLSWNADSDVDLQIVDPNGNEVERTTIRSAGKQIADSNAGCDLDGIRNEHVAWPAESAIPGVYTVSLHYASSCDVFETDYIVRVNNGGETSTFSGTLTSADDYREVVTLVTIPDAEPPPRRRGRTLQYRGSGDQVFILNPAGKILEDASFALRLGAASAEVYVIATNTVHHPMNPHVERLDRTEAAAHGTLAQAAMERSARRTAAASVALPRRSWITEFNNNAPLAPAGVCRASSSQPAVREGITEFAFLDLDEVFEPVEIPATARKVVRDGTTTLVVWVPDASWGPCAGCVDEQMVEAVAEQLQPDERNDVYNLVTAIFGEPWGSHDRPCLIPAAAAGELHVLLYDIDADGVATDDAANESHTLGFFAAKDNYLRIEADPITGTSNERLMLYLDAPLLAHNKDQSWELSDYWPRQVISTLAHELQHMIHFFQKRVVQGARSETWLNEMASEVAEDLVVAKLEIAGLDGPRGVAHDDPTAGDPGNSRGRLPRYNLHNDLQVTTWDGTLRRSSINYALGAYLVRTYGGAALFRDIVQSELEGIDAIEAAIRERHTFGDVLVNWGIANLLSDNLHLAEFGDEYRYYQYNSGTWTRSTEGGATFLLGSINLYHYRYVKEFPQQSPSTSQEGPFLYSLDGFNERTQPPHSNMYATLGRNTGTVRLRVDAVRDNRITVVVKE